MPICKSSVITNLKGGAFLPDELPDYKPTPIDVAEVKVHARKMLISVIAQKTVYFSGGIRGGGIFDANITHPGKKDRTASSNIRWYPWDDAAMFRAYGGADLNATGKAYVIERPQFIFGFIPMAPSYTWHGRFNVSLGDLYIFESSEPWKTYATARWRPSYDAGLYLELYCGFRPFYHKMEFKLTFDRKKLAYAVQPSIGGTSPHFSRFFCILCLR